MKKFGGVLVAASVLTTVLLCPEATLADTLFQDGIPAVKHSAPELSDRPNFSDLARELSKSVVNISGESDSTLRSKVGDQEGNKEEDAPPKEAPRGPGGGPMRSEGSGFIVHEDGFIVTNFHVIDQSDSIVVRLLDDKTEYPATVIGRDAKTDLALVKIKVAHKLPTVFLGNSDELQVGEWVLAIGNQFQLGQTVTAGIVSAKSRQLPTRALGPYDSFIQTDASINPGSSGGPLFNTKGQVVGINSAIFSPGRSQFGGTGFNIGIGFSIPINMARKVLLQLKEQGKVVRGLLGVVIQPIDVDTAKALGLESPYGALVSDIMPDTPASRAGFERRDVIVAFDGHDIREHHELPLLVAGTAIGATVDVGVIRAGKIVTLKATIQELKDQPLSEARVEEKPNEIGITTQEISPEIAKALKLPKNLVGVVVSGLEPNSPAHRAGLAPGDVVLELANRTITDVASLNAAIKLLKPGTPALVLIRRGEATRYFIIKLR